MDHIRVLELISNRTIVLLSIILATKCTTLELELTPHAKYINGECETSVISDVNKALNCLTYPPGYKGTLSYNNNVCIVESISNDVVEAVVAIRQVYPV